MNPSFSDIREALSAALHNVAGSDWPIIWDNLPPDRANLNSGYILCHIHFGRFVKTGIGQVGQREGQLNLGIAVPVGRGVTATDHILERIQNQLSHQSIGVVETHGLHLSPSFVVDGFWQIDCVLEFAVWHRVAS